MKKGSVIVFGVGPGLGASVARRFSKSNFSIGLVARNSEKLLPIVDDINSNGGNAIAYGVDATIESDVRDIFLQSEKELGPVNVAVYNAGLRIRKPILELNSDEFVSAWKLSCYGGFLVGREAAKYMIPRGVKRRIKPIENPHFARNDTFVLDGFALLALPDVK